jgi:hypothetical protein
MPTQAYCFHMNEVFANRSEVDKMYPHTTEEIAEAQTADASLKHLFKRNAVIDQGLAIKLIELSWQCWQHVDNTLETRQKVTKFGSTFVLVPTQKGPRHKNFASEITNKL